MVLCGATGAYCLLRTRSGTEEERRTARAEGLMGLGMAAMAVPAAVFTLPGWTWAVYAVLFGGAALRVLMTAPYRAHHLHHLVGSLAMVYMAVAMAPGAGQGVRGGHMDHGSAASAGGIPLLTGVLLTYYALYVLRSAGRLIPVTAAVSPGSAGGAAGPGREARPELALACRLTMGIGMFAMLLTL